ncbi:MAG: TetR/AcrR family transcriptional regulator [Deltaproteobacteria bacterium]|nr:TetR/AcrR family transcriptional regulator [Deltaproteobacteria bacterium]
MGVAERREREKQQRRDQAIQAAMEIYNEEGYYAITMDKISERAELSRASLYIYFKNKDEIFISAIKEYMDYFCSLLDDIYTRRQSIHERLLDELWACFTRFYQKDPVAFNLSMYFHQNEVVRNLSNELRELLYRAGSDAVTYQHKIAEYGVEQGIFIDCNARTLAEVIWSSFLGIMQVERSKGEITGKNHIEATRDLALEVLARGIVRKINC